MTDTGIERIINDFFKSVGEKKIEIYNEFSLQHELGCYLRGKFKNEDENKKIQFEKNVKDFEFDKNLFLKKEIDISIFKDSNNLSSVIELKYPKNGQYPESMFSFCKDIVFLEQLVNSGFETGYFIAVADDPLFYEGGKAKNGIYKYFRDSIDPDGKEKIKETITGKITKPTGLKEGSKVKEIIIKGKYTVDWKQIKDSDENVLKNDLGHEYKYCMIKIIKTTEK